MKWCCLKVFHRSFATCFINIVLNGRRTGCCEFSSASSTTYNPSQNILRPTPNGLIFCSFLWKNICSLRKGNNIYAPPPTKQCCFQVIIFTPKSPPITPTTWLCQRKGVENRCSLRIFVKDCRSHVQRIIERNFSIRFVLLLFGVFGIGDLNMYTRDAMQPVLVFAMFFVIYTVTIWYSTLA